MTEKIQTKEITSNAQRILDMIAKFELAIEQLKSNQELKDLLLGGLAQSLGFLKRDLNNHGKLIDIHSWTEEDEIDPRKQEDLMNKMSRLLNTLSYYGEQKMPVVKINTVEVNKSINEVDKMISEDLMDLGWN